MIGNDWDQVLEIVWKSEGFNKFMHIVDNEYNNKTIYPPKDYIFNALKLTPYSKTKVVIVGQDPYHGEKEAHGLSFSVQKGIKIPPSLKNIYEELYNDLGIEPAKYGDLTKWAKEGVLMLNSVLTVVKDSPGSHRGKGWEIFTDEVIKAVNEKNTPVVFLLWGAYAKEKKNLITNPIHLVLESSHPSPFSVKNGFEGCSHFSKTNEFLKSKGLTPIDWQIENI